MKKNVFLLALVSSSFAFSQVGFNTPNPEATVDIKAKYLKGGPTNVSPRNVEGLLIPRVDRQRAQNMLNIPLSTIIFINDISTGSQVGIATGIDEIGYYYYNNTEWIKLKSGNANMYNTNAALSENRTISQDDKTLAFKGTSINSFSIDDATFSVDASHNRIGMGTKAPISDVQIVGNELRLGGPSTQEGTVANPLLRIHSNANADGSGGEIRFSEDNAAYGYYIRHNTEAGDTYGLDGLAIGANAPGTFYYNPAKPGMFVSSSQHVGFGTATPQTVFQIDGARDNNINMAPTATQEANDIAVTDLGDVGMGTLSPRGALDINNGQTNNHGLVLPTNANVNNFTNPRGGSVAPGTIIYDSTNDCVRFYKKNGNWSKCVDDTTLSPETGKVMNLDSAHATSVVALKKEKSNS
ncbi:hypothetical protein [Chryseobacterium sp. ERMR1:04]|uniref:hypothetical protein n=1 Tax=Chryseobacterium sp. ERMR1:04 TaxID=1705393 RepID=UPI0006C8B782|nr:hypothetical protein [Chryseobacterium sp. ERMR1:04]KPH13838.1 hypothetical protein AMQ68_09930 [Chryseobacterium sp. ERMR1:04]